MIVDTNRGRLAAVSAALGSLMTAACGGGVAPTPAAPTQSTAPVTTAPAPPPAPTPAPAPTPLPPASSFQTAEFQRTTDLDLTNPIPAYQRGYTGTGIRVGVIDSGIDLNSPEFTGRIDFTYSRNVATGGTLQDQNGHGTAVATVIAANKNDSFSHGIAYDSTLLVERTDSSCTNANCNYNDPDIAAGIDNAVRGGARLINISLGGSPASAMLVNAVARATAAGVIVVISAGNDGNTQIDQLPASLLDTPNVSHGLIVVAGATATGTTNLVSFSNQAGTHAADFITAPGQSIYVRGLSGGAFLYSGTSFSAPYVVGALALLLQAFPTLTPAQAISLLYTSATDTGAPGVDAVYGHGFINVGNAFQPQGTQSIPSATQTGASVPVSGGGVQLGTAFGRGTAVREALRHVVILDGFGRPFTVDLSGSIRPASNSAGLTNALVQAGLTIANAQESGPVHIAFSATDHRQQFATLDANLPASNRPISFTDIHSDVDFTLSSSLRVGFSHGDDVTHLLATPLSPSGHFLIDHDGLATNDSADSAHSRLDFGAWRLGIAVGSGRSRTSLAGSYTLRTSTTTSAATSLTRQLGPFDLTLVGRWTEERGSVLGAVAGSNIDVGRGAQTLALEWGSHWQLSRNWQISGTASLGQTAIDAGQSAFTQGVTHVVTTAFRAELSGNHLLGNDELGMRVSQPLRIERGNITYNLPVSYDYFSHSAVFAPQQVGLAAEGRELDFEGHYGRPFAFGMLRLNIFTRLEPGHVAGASPDAGFAVRFNTNF